MGSLPSPGASAVRERAAQPMEPPVPPVSAQPGSGSEEGPTRSPATAPDLRIVVRDAEFADVAATARLHVRNLPLGLFPRLGERFVARWHRAFVESPNAVALVAVDPVGRVTGFLVGALDQPAFRQELLTRHRTGLVIRGAAALAVRPRVLALFLRTRLRPYLRRLGPSRRPAATAPIGPTVSAPSGAGPVRVADLSAVAVDPTLRRSGTGRRLTEEFLARCAAAGAGRVELVTAADSASSCAFYTRTGWTAQRRSRTRDGHELQPFVQCIDRAKGV